MLDTGDPISSNLLTTSLHCFPGGSDSKESGCSAADPGSILGLGRSLGEREWLSTPIFLLGEFHGQSSLAGYSPRSCKESDTTERLIQHSLQTMPGDYLTLYPRQHLVLWLFFHSDRHVVTSHCGFNLQFSDG